MLSIDAEESLHNIVAGDFNGDGAVDLAAVSRETGTLSLFENDGQRNFSVTSPISVGANPRSIVSQDIDDDGDLDLLVGNFDDDSVTVLLNRGNATFDMTLVATGDGPIGIAAKDVDGDGITDLAVVNSLTDTVAVFTGRGNGQFVAPVEFETGDVPYDVEIVDMDW